jgi:tetratricopeptide (TPR) repeat protein
MKIKLNVNINFLLIVSLICGLPVVLQSQSAHKLKLKAQDEYDKAQFEKAEKYYKKALTDKKEITSEFNIANTLFKLKRYDEAAELYNKALDITNDKNLKSNTLHNLGNTYFEDKKIQESIAKYKEALKLNPDRSDTRRNLAIAKQKLKEQQQQKKTNKDQKENDKSSDKNNDKNKENKSDSKNQNSQQKQKTSKEELEKLLKNIEEEEKEIQKRIIKTSGKSSKRLKDW